MYKPPITLVTWYPATALIQHGTRTRVASVLVAAAMPRFMELMTQTTAHITFFGAHVHSTDNTSHVDHSARRHGWRDFCVGGGGGWACDGPQGFVVGEVLDTGRIVNLRMKLMPMRDCCFANPRGR